MPPVAVCLSYRRPYRLAPTCPSPLSSPPSRASRRRTSHSRRPCRATRHDAGVERNALYWYWPVARRGAWLYVHLAAGHMPLTMTSTARVNAGGRRTRSCVCCMQTTAASRSVAGSTTRCTRRSLTWPPRLRTPPLHWTPLRTMRVEQWPSAMHSKWLMLPSTCVRASWCTRTCDWGSARLQVGAMVLSRRQLWWSMKARCWSA